MSEDRIKEHAKQIREAIVAESNRRSLTAPVESLLLDVIAETIARVEAIESRMSRDDSDAEAADEQSNAAVPS